MALSAHMEKILRILKRKLSAHMESTEEKTFCTHGEHRRENFLHIWKAPKIKGSWKY